jgi:hypothetical protein
MGSTIYSTSGWPGSMGDLMICLLWLSPPTDPYARCDTFTKAFAGNVWLKIAAIGIRLERLVVNM